MTSRFRRVAKCKECGNEIPLEDEIGQWVRGHPQLDSAKGFVFMDRDIVVHRYKADHRREFQCVMFIEVKSHGASLNDSQRDTMFIIDQLFRNDRSTPTKKCRSRASSTPSTAYSLFRKTHVAVKALGYHLLKMNGSTPDNSTEIFWDRRQIDVGMLIDILRFEVHPDTLRKMDFRIHHAMGIQLNLEDYYMFEDVTR